MEEYLTKLKTELVMKSYHDGWTAKWLKNKIKEIESQLGFKKHNLNDQCNILYKGTQPRTYRTY